MRRGWRSGGHGSKGEPTWGRRAMWRLGFDGKTNVKEAHTIEASVVEEPHKVEDKP